MSYVVLQPTVHIIGHAQSSAVPAMPLQRRSTHDHDFAGDGFVDSSLPRNITRWHRGYSPVILGSGSVEFSKRHNEGQQQLLA